MVGESDLDRTSFVQRAISMRGTAAKPVTDAMRQIYHRIFAMGDLVMPDGKVAHVAPQFGPETDRHGSVRCGFEVEFEDGLRLQFIIENRGIGMTGPFV